MRELAVKDKNRFESDPPPSEDQLPHEPVKSEILPSGSPGQAIEVQLVDDTLYFSYQFSTCCLSEEMRLTPMRPLPHLRLDASGRDLDRE